jgi:glutaredoxin
MQLTIYSKPGCHLCDEMKAVVKQAIRERDDISVEEIDITHDPTLRERYELEIPVLLIDGRKAAKYRIAEKELLKAIAGTLKS